MFSIFKLFQSEPRLTPQEEVILAELTAAPVIKLERSPTLDEYYTLSQRPGSVILDGLRPEEFMLAPVVKAREIITGFEPAAGILAGEEVEYRARLRTSGLGRWGYLPKPDEEITGFRCEFAARVEGRTCGGCTLDVRHAPFEAAFEFHAKALAAFAETRGNDLLKQLHAAGDLFRKIAASLGLRPVEVCYHDDAMATLYLRNRRLPQSSS